jgi:hypothetical protein
MQAVWSARAKEPALATTILWIMREPSFQGL